MSSAKKLSNTSRMVLYCSAIIVTIIGTTGMLLAAEEKQGAVSMSQQTPSFVLTQDNDRVSLKANEASLTEVLEELGQKVNFDIESHVTTDEKISIEFHDLSVEDALKKITRNYAIISDQKDGTIAKIILFPIGQEGTRFNTGQQDKVLEGQKGMGSATTKQPTRPQRSSAPFEFSFDPSEFMKENK